MRSAVRAVLRWGLLLGLLAATLWLTHRLVSEAGWDVVRSAVVRADPFLIAGAVALKLAVLAVWGGRWLRAVWRLDRTSPGWLLLSAQAVGILLNHVVPFARVAGGLARTRYLAGLSRLSAAPAFGSVLFDQVVHLLTLGGITLGALATAAALVGRAGLAAAALGALAACAAVGWAIRRRRGTPLTSTLADFLAARGARREGSAGGRLLEGAGRAVEVVSELAADRRLWGETVALGFLLFALNALTQWTVFAALGRVVDPWVVAVAVTVGAMAGVLAGTPGGLGGTEAAMIAFYGLLGVEPALGAAGTLLFRAIHYAVVIAAGVPALVLLELRLARQPDED